MLLECVPNISEGRDPVLVAELESRCLRNGMHAADCSLDPDHHRAVLTWIGKAQPLVDAAVELCQGALQHLTLIGHDGVHPRVGVVDVIPFVPLRDTPMRVAIEAAHAAGKRIGELGIPVFLYEQAASTPERRNLAWHRRGGLQGLRRRMADSTWLPDFGPPQLHPTAGAVVVGARPFLVAFNVELAAADLTLARRIAASIRYTAPRGLPGVKALGLPLPGRGTVMVSINLFEVGASSLHEVVTRITDEAATEGVAVRRSELIGLLPEQALLAAAADALRLPRFDASRIVERNIPKDLGDSHL